MEEEKSIDLLTTEFKIALDELDKARTLASSSWIENCVDDIKAQEKDAQAEPTWNT